MRLEKCQHNQKISSENRISMNRSRAVLKLDNAHYKKLQFEAKQIVEICFRFSFKHEKTHEDDDDDDE